jgi:hypothetical protein
MTQAVARLHSSDEDDLEKIMVKLKAAAAKAQQLPPSRTNNKHVVIVAAIGLISGVVTAQYLIPGHSRPSTALPKPVRGDGSASVISARYALK